MTDSPTQIKWAVSIVLVLVASAGLFIWFKPNEKVENVSEDKVEINKNLVIEELKKQHDAMTDWNKESTSTLYTIDLQKILITGRPLIFTGSVSDVAKASTDNLVTFVSDDLDLTLRLTCSESVTQKIDRGFYTNYVLVAKITNVTKPLLQI